MGDSGGSITIIFAVEHAVTEHEFGDQSALRQIVRSPLFCWVFDELQSGSITLFEVACRRGGSGELFLHRDSLAVQFADLFLIRSDEGGVVGLYQPVHELSGLAFDLA
ncbi:hypothetical protein [Filomicrobium insigne]|uniref:hypothetical protein n=1 Tax=Filomicrobium insigne TaxID=418854 RepID=UPI001AECDD63|nr:hypothetical protein [Filomicrobium insigne]